MGASNVAKVFAYWSRLKHREVRLLTYMANMSMDQDAPPVYFGGWEAAAGALGMDPKAKRDSSKETFRQAVAALRESGAVVSSGHARMGVRAEYALTLDPATTYQPIGEGRNVKWEPIKRGKGALPQQGQEDIAPPTQADIAPGGASTAWNRGKGALPPRSTQEQQEEYIEEQHHEPAAVSPAHAETLATNGDEWSSIPEEKRTPEWQQQQLIRMQAEYERQEAERKAS